ncbi:MAG: baseplate assembly protein [Phage 64_12]|nr:GPW/gp25 family protein [Xanthomonadales bacterium]QOR55671.1 MAG: baseplate assembly protein [Phage 64_12]
MRGMDATTGKPIEGEAHLVQSMSDILTTPIGSRVMRRDYGSRLLELVDAPFNAATRLQLYSAVATALLRWEPRISLTRVEISVGDRRGAFVIDLEAARTDLPKPAAVKFSFPVRLTAGATSIA